MKSKDLLFAILFLTMISCGDDYNFSSPKSAYWDVVNEKNENLEISARSMSPPKGHADLNPEYQSLSDRRNRESRFAFVGDKMIVETS